jgi:hypothetical protein
MNKNFPAFFLLQPVSNKICFYPTSFFQMAFISADTLLSFNGLPDNLLYSNFKHIVNERIWHMILPTTFFFPPPLLGVFRRSSGLQHRRIPFRRRQKMDT